MRASHIPVWSQNFLFTRAGNIDLVSVKHWMLDSLRGRRKKGRERGREKSTKEGKWKGAPAIRAGVFVIHPPFSQLIR